MTPRSVPLPRKISNAFMMEGVAVILLVVILFPATYVVAGFALMNLWNWFIVPPTHYAELSFWGAVGISLVAGILKMNLSTYKEKDPDADKRSLPGRISATISTQIGVYAFILLEGWFIHTFLV